MSASNNTKRYWIDENGILQNAELDPRTSRQKITRSDLLSRSPQTAARKPAKSVENSQISEVECSRCGITLQKDQMETHLLTHSPQRRPKINRARIRSPKELSEMVARSGRIQQPIPVACPICSLRFERTQINEHCLKVHGKKYSVKPKGKTKAKRKKTRKKRSAAAKKVHRKSGAGPRPAGRPMTRCPHCTSDVRVDRLNKHIRKVHHQKGKSIPERRSRQGGSGYDHRIDDDRYRNKQHESQTVNRDGSKDWGHMRRENGRFGSFPVFDDYGEESMP